MPSKLNELRGNPDNPRSLSEEQAKILKHDLEKYGDLSGFVFNTQTGNLVGGHQRKGQLPENSRIEIIQRYSPPTRTGTTAEGFVIAEDTQERYAYREVAWSAQTEMAANIAANKAGGEWDFKKLASWSGELIGEGWEPRDLGFGERELEDILAPYRTMPDSEAEDDVPEPPKKAKTKRGELWILGNHRLLIEDCTVKENVERLMAGEKADMVFTDPPYGMNLDTDYSGMGETTTTYREVEGDNKPFDPRHIFDIAADEYWLWGADYYAQRIPKYEDGSFTVWTKAHSDEENKVWTSRFELVWVYPRRKKEVWFVRSMQHLHAERLGEHPTQKPVELAVRAFSVSKSAAASIWDGYLGSGSTLIACEKTNRRCFGMEIEPLYGDVIIQRWEKFSGKMAYREDGKSYEEVSAER